jgi:thiol-disulfide isomerase/thioredoxin
MLKILKILNISVLNWLLIILIIIISSFKKSKEDFTIENKIIKSTIPNVNKKITVYNFNTVWCGHSRKFQPIFDEFKNKNESNDVNIIDVKCDDENNLKLCQKYKLPGFPTVLFVEGNRIEEYQGNRTVEDLTNTLNIFQGN